MGDGKPTSSSPADAAKAVASNFSNAPPGQVTAPCAATAAADAAKAEAAKKAEAARIAKQMQALATEGHGPQRHEGQVTPQQLVDRAIEGKDPMTGTTVDGVTGKKHSVGPTASKVNSEEAYAKADDALRNSQQFKDAEAATRQKMADVAKAQDAIVAQTKKDGDAAVAAAKGQKAIDKAKTKAANDLKKAQEKAEDAKEAAAQMPAVNQPLQDIYGPDYKKNVTGVTRTSDKATTKQAIIDGKKPETLGQPTDFTDGTMQGFYRIENGKPVMTTMYPNPKS